VPKFDRALSGGKAISGGALGLRSRRGNTNQVDSYWRGGGVGAPPSVEVLIVAGGGGGGRNDANGAGAGGAGGYLEGSLVLSATTAHDISIGAGGASRTTTQQGAIGSNSYINALIALGGGGGGVGEGGAGTAGGSGGGAGPNSANNGASTQTNQGTLTKYANAGGTSTGLGGAGGGGGGAGAAAGNSATGGAGRANTITGSSVTYAVGGSYLSGAGVNGAANSGNGGSGSFQNNSGAGGSGVVVIAYPNSFSQIKTFTGGLSVIYSGVSRAGFHVYTFTAGTGTISW